MKKFKKILRSITLIFLCTMCVCLSACVGGWNLGDIGDDDVDDYQFGLSLDNIKVLRKSYDPESAAVKAQQYNFYDAYVQQILQYLNSSYGILNSYYKAGLPANFDNVFGELYTELEISDTNSPIYRLATELEANADYFKYYCDAIRYQVESVEEIYSYQPKYVKVEVIAGVPPTITYTYSNAETKPEGYVDNETIFEKDNVPNGLTEEDFINNSEKIVTKYKVTFNTSYGWNWGLNYDLISSKALASVYNLVEVPDVSKIINGEGQITTVFNMEDYKFKFQREIDNKTVGFYGYYNVDNYVPDIDPFNENVYASALYGSIEPVKKLIGYDPVTLLPIYENSKYEMQVNNPTDMQSALTYVVYSIVNNNVPATISVEDKGTSGTTLNVEGFDSVGDALEAEKAEYAAKATYVGVTEGDQQKLVEYILKYVIGEEAVNHSKGENNGGLYDLHYEEVVTAIVKYCSELTQTGYSTSEGGTSSTYIGGQYMSSDIADYEYSSGYVNGDALGFEEFAHLGQYEYQSMMIMPTKAAMVDEIWMDFGYLGNGGTNDSITIRTYVRNYVGNGVVEEYFKDITVLEGIVDVGEDGTTLVFDFNEMKADKAEKYLKCDVINFNDAINSYFYQARVKGVLNVYADQFLPRDMVIGPDTEARNYYSLVEGDYRDYGVFNYEMLKKADEANGTNYYNSSYIEVAFEVLSATTDNYKFYCGFSLINEYFEPDYSGFH